MSTARNQYLLALVAKRVAWLLFSLPVFVLQLPGQQPLHDHVRPAVSSGQAAMVGSLPAARRLDLAIMLPPRNQADLTSLISSLYDPFSPRYHQFLSVAEFTEQFGPSAEDYQAVTAFAKANGFTVRDAAANRMVVSINGTVSQIEKTFHVSMKLYRHPVENRTFYSPDREPTLAVSVPVLHIEGLNDYSPPRAMALKAAIKPAAGELLPAGFTGSGPGNAFLASDMRAAYCGGISLNGAGQTVGLFEAIPYDINDVNLTFANAGQIYNVPITNVLLDGFINGSGQNDVEPVLDIVQAIGMAPRLSQVRVYLGSNPMDILNTMASENIAKQISISYVWEPDSVPAYEVIFQEYAAQGQTVFASSGDYGAYIQANSNYYPAEDPYVTAVGGTTLTTYGAGGAWASEISWFDSGGGVGFDPYSIAIPSWQLGLASAANGGSPTLRNVPDVAMDGAFHNYACQALLCSGDWGGTSFSAPRWAGYMALVNEQAQQQGKTTLGFINPTLYSLNETSSYLSNFHDISDGGNNQCCSQTVFYSAVAGYDLVTGWGSPKGQNLINTLAGGYTVSASSSSLSVYQGSSVTATVAVTDQGGFTSSVNLLVTGLPTGATASFGANPASGSSVLTLTAGASTAPGSYTLTIFGLASGVTETTSLTLNILSAGSAPNTPYVAYVAFWGVNNSGVTISWSTDIPANTQLAYGTTTSLGQFTPLQTALSNSHGVVLTGLNSGTTYYFVAQSTGSNGLTGYSTVYSFTTTGAVSNPAPVISAITAALITSNSATITWTTDQPSYSQVNYGTTTSYGSLVTLTPLVTNHSVTLTGLTPGTAYNFDVSSGNSQSVSSTSANQTFVTAAGNPVISNVQAITAGPTVAAITWNTDQATTSLVNYGTTTSYGSVSALNPSLVTSHSVILSGLAGGTTYQFQVVSVNSANETVTSQNYSFTTPPVASTPVISSVTVTATTSTTATIGWITDQPTTSQVNYGTTSSYGSSSTMVTTLSTSHLVTLTGLSASTTYNFDVVSANSANIAAASPNGTFTTAASTVTPPYVGYVNFWGVTSSGVTISWSTDVPANTQLAYGTTASLGQLTPVQSALTASHGVVLTGLSSGTAYYFVAQSTGANGATGYSGTYSFTTTGTPGGGTPVISNVAASGIGTATATITWTTDQPATSLVNYGVDTSLGGRSTLGTALVTTHSVTLTGLLPGTKYYFDAESTNAAQLSAISPQSSFSTLTPAGPPPIVSYVNNWGITDTGVTISWSTDVPATTAVAYGTTPALGQMSPIQSALTNSHGVTLTGLTAGTTYYFVAQSTGVNGQTGYSATDTVTTTGTALPVISAVIAAPASNNSAVISWTTSVPAVSYVQFGTTTAYDRYSSETSLTTNPQPAMGYVPSGVIHYQLVSTDAQGHQVVSPDYQFTEP